MELLIRLSLILNIAVLVPVSAGIYRRADWTVAAYGQHTAALDILLSVYLAILVVSAGLLVRPVPAMVAALLTVQVIYKLTTPLTVQSLSNPVVLSNLAIAGFHVFTLYAIARHSSP